MNKLYKFYIILLLLLIILYLKKNNIESFITSQFSGKYCTGCGSKNRHKCSKCVNCGYCFPQRAPPSCVPGDAQGPYFREDCLNYEYMYPASSLIGKNQGIISLQSIFGTYPYYLLHNYLNPFHYIYYTDSNYYDNRIDKLNNTIDKLKNKIKYKWYKNNNVNNNNVNNNNVQPAIPQINNNVQPAIPQINNDVQPAIPQINNDVQPVIPQFNNNVQPAIPQINNDVQPAIPQINNDVQPVIPQNNDNINNDIFEENDEEKNEQ